MGMPRMTLQTQLVLQSSLGTSEQPKYGMQLCHLAGLPSDTIYPILARLEQIDWGGQRLVVLRYVG